MTLELYSGDLPCKSKLVNCDHKSLCVSPTRLETTNRRSSLEIAYFFDVGVWQNEFAEILHKQKFRQPILSIVTIYRVILLMHLQDFRTT